MSSIMMPVVPPIFSVCLIPSGLRMSNTLNITNAPTMMPMVRSGSVSGGTMNRMWRAISCPAHSSITNSEGSSPISRTNHIADHHPAIKEHNISAVNIHGPTQKKATNPSNQLTRLPSVPGAKGNNTERVNPVPTQ